MATLHERRTQRLRLDEKTLAESAQQLLALDSSIQFTKDHIAQLTVDLRAAEEWRVDLAQRHDALRGLVQEQRRELAPFGHCAEEVLAAIFLQLAYQPDTQWTKPGGGYYNAERAKRPFIVSAVSRHWRSAALGTTQIWDYAGVPNLDTSPENAPLFVERIRMVVSRSGVAPLDVLFHQIASDQHHAVYETILSILYPHISRWRRCEIWANDQFPALVSYLRGRVPNLEELSIAHMHGVPSQWSGTGTVYLENSAKLRCVVLQNAALAFDTRSGRHPSLHQLTLTVPAGMPSHLLWNTFSAVSNLAVLDLSVADGAAIGEPPAIDLPSLQSLLLREGACQIPITFPAAFGLKMLRNIVFERAWSGDPGDSLADLREFLCRPMWVRPHQHLTLSKTTLGSQDGAFLAEVLPDICTFTLLNCTIDAQFWTSLRAGFRELTVVALATTVFNPGTSEEFIDFVRYCTIRGRAAEGPAAFQLRVNIAATCNVSERDREELKSILAS